MILSCVLMQTEAPCVVHYMTATFVSATAAPRRISAREKRSRVSDSPPDERSLKQVKSEKH